jgi:hypothetical protein
MPYITQEHRSIMRAGAKPCTVGELNYVITRLCRDYWRDRGSYQAINDVLGALEGAKLEFYRRVAAPYEERKIAENGDVY